MPKSRHRRKGKIRPRPQQLAPPPVRPRPSSPWVPRIGVALILIGIGTVIINYIPGLLERNWVLIVGFVFMAVGFAFLTRWR